MSKRTVTAGKTPYHTDRKRKAGVPPATTLPRCGECGSYELGRRRRGAKYCSVKCRVQAFHKRQRAAHRGLTRGEVVTLRALVIHLDSALTRLRKIRPPADPLLLWHLERELARRQKTLYRQRLYKEL